MPPDNKLIREMRQTISRLQNKLDKIEREKAGAADVAWDTAKAFEELGYSWHHARLFMELAEIQGKPVNEQTAGAFLAEYGHTLPNTKRVQEEEDE